MSLLSEEVASRRPLIGCTTYRKQVGQLEIVGLNSPYTKAIMQAGGIPVLIPLCLDESAARQIFERVDGLLLPGGSDIDFTFYSREQEVPLRGVDRERDQLELALAKTAVHEEKPILAICRGHQVLNVALGGTLWQDVYTQLPGAMKHDYASPFPRGHLAHSVMLSPGTLLAHLLEGPTLPVNSIHHQGVRDLAPGLIASAWAEDGLIEGIELPGHPFAVGVQWHPEGLYQENPVMLTLFKGLVHSAVNGRV